MGTRYIGLDLGSTTAKIVIADHEMKTLYSSYVRHFSRVREKCAEMVEEAKDYLIGHTLHVAVTGSAGFGVCSACGLDLVQEVFATAGAVREFLPGSDAVIELGGEDAKIIFLTGGLEERMNGSCAGGTGAFIDQMATLLDITPEQLNEYASRHERIYPIASRCGVFAKSDLQPLINQGAAKEDLSASILQAVVSQTISGLAQGRQIKGKVVFLGGPLFFFSELRRQFAEALNLSPENTVFPDNAACFVALGAALYAKTLNPTDYDTLIAKLRLPASMSERINSLFPLFSTEAEYEEFKARHSSIDVGREDPVAYTGDAYLGIDAGSTTTKLALITPEGKILYDYYAPNKGNPISVVLNQLKIISALCSERIKILTSCVTGYGEALIQNAFGVDFGCVETVAHLMAGQRFNPNVDYILDIGGQDIKCFKINHGTVDAIMLNEACSSGCGSFIETYATALGYSVADFAKLGLFAKAPANLGFRCTVFMNSSIKQAQREGATVEDISAGLSISVVKNVMYKVIRVPNPDLLGHNIVVQGGTFINDAILRAFELEVGRNVVRPPIAGLMGAYGAALYAKSRFSGKESTLLITQTALDGFTHTSRPADCGLCGNHCHLTVNMFDGKRRFISGNRCERPNGATGKSSLPNMYAWKYDYLTSLKSAPGKRGKIGIPMGLNMYENLPFWHAMLTKLGFEVVLSPASSKDLYALGRHTIPSDTVCYPAKLLHGHIQALIDEGVTTIFYPCMPYNFNENKGDNHYNCPVVAYYPELLEANVAALKSVKYLAPYAGIHKKKGFKESFGKYMEENFGILKHETEHAVDAGYAAYDDYLAAVRAEGERVIAWARKNDKLIIVLAGRPYHIDPEINHGIDELITSLGMIIVTEDAVASDMPKKSVKVLNQWTYHSRLYAAAEYVSQHDGIELIQLVSFGCGLDAITTDEVRDILESHGRIYTQLKIDEITSLSTVRIRLRSFLAAVEARKKKGLN